MKFITHLKFILATLLVALGSTAWAQTWVKTAPTDLQTGDIVVIVDQTSATALSNANGTSVAPAATAVTLNDDMSELTSEVNDAIQWVVTVTEGSYQFNIADTEDYLYCTNANNGVRVGSNENNAFTITTGGDNDADFLVNTATSRYIGVYNNQDWRCYTTINSNIKGCVTAFYKKTEGNVDNRIATAVEFGEYATTGVIGETIALPTATVTADGVAIEGASVNWTSSNEDVATIEDGNINLLAVGTTTIKALFMADDTYKESSKSYTLTVTAAPFTSLKDLQEAVTSTSTPVAITFTNVSVNAVKGSNAYLSDADGYGILVYQSNHGLEAGQVLNGTINANLVLYRGQTEITNFSTEGLEITTTELIPTVKTIDAITAANQSTLVTLENVKYVDGKLTDGTNEITFYDTFSVSPEFDADKAYNITGIVILYNETLEFAPRSAEDIEEYVEPVPDPDYAVKVAPAENGNIEVELGTAKEGDVITPTITPAEGYELESLRVYYITIVDDPESGESSEMENDVELGEGNSFVMPAHDVIITATFKETIVRTFADGKYYLKNVSTGLFWGAANNWGTQASLVSEEQYATLVMLEDGTYTLESMVSNGGTAYYFNGSFMDGGSPVHLTITEIGDGVYTFSNGEVYYGSDGNSTVLAQVAADSEGAKWNVLTQEDIDAAHAAVLASASVDAPADVTFLIKDALFGRNRRDVSAWTMDAANQNLTGGGDKGGCAESYHSVFTLSQVIENAPKGVYKLGASAFYRQDGSDNDNLPYIYITDGTDTATSPFGLRTGSENNMNDAAGAFNNGSYVLDPAFFELSEAGNLTVGAKLETNTTLWCIWGHFTLSYYGPDADINEVKFGALVNTVNELVEKATELKDNANVSAATVTALEAAIEGAEGLETEEAYNTAIAALTVANDQAALDIKNKAAIDAMYTLIENTNVYTAEAYDTFKASADAYQAAWEEGTITETVVNPSLVAGWHSANNYDDFLLSAWTIGGTQCKDFDTSLYINTWSTEGEGDGSDFKVPFFEYWTGDGNSLGANTLTATVEGQEQGKYLVNAWVRVRAKDGYTAPAYGITMDVNGGDETNVAAGEQIGTSQFFIAQFTAVGTVAEDGVLKVNFNVAEDNNISWLSFKNVKFEKFSEATNLDFELTEAITDGICTYAKDMSKNNTVHFGAQAVDGWDVLNVTDNVYEGADRGALDQKAGGVFAYGSDAWLGGPDFKAPATAPEGSEGTKALGLVSVWGGDNAVIQYTQPVTLEAGNYELTVLLQNTAGTNALTQNLIGFIGEDGTSYLAETKQYPVGEWYTETITFTLNDVTKGKLSLGFQNASGSGAAPHIFIDNVSIKRINEEEIAAARLAAAKEKATAALDRLTPFGDALFMYSEEEVNTAKAAVEAATTVEEVEAIEMPQANAPVEGTKYTFQQKASGLYLSTYVTTDEAGEVTASGVKLSAEPVAFTFEAGEGGYYLANGEEYVGFAGTNNWTMAATADKKIIITPAPVQVEDVYYYTLNEVKGMIASDGTEEGAACYTDKSIAKSGDKAYWTIAEYVAPADPNDFTSYIVNADLTGEGGFDATGTKGIDGSGIVKASNNAQFDFKQTIENLPAGKYKLTAQAAYRYSGSEADEAAAIEAGTETKFATLYATVGETTVTTLVQNRYDGASETDLAGEGAVQVGDLWVPNSSNAVKAWFAAGEYENYVEFNLLADGAVTIGIVKTAQPEAGDYTVIGPWTLTRIGDAEEPVAEPLELTLNVERMATQGYNVDVATVDFTEAKEFLGVEEITTDMLRIVNPDGTEISDYAPFDGWFNEEGVATSWGSTTKICVKFFQAIPNGTYEICDMNSADEVGKTYTVKWALNANDKKVIYTINVTFVEPPVYQPEIVGTYEFELQDNANTAYGDALVDKPEAMDMATMYGIFGALGISSFDEAGFYIVNVTTGNFVQNTTDGWRNADGDASAWGTDEMGYCLKLGVAEDGTLDVYYAGAYGTGYNVGDTFLAQWALVKDDKAVLLKYTVNFVQKTATAINGIAFGTPVEGAYDLTGRKADTLIKGRMYIINGKKTLVK